MQKHSVAIIILNWNGYDFTRACLKSLEEVTFKEFEIILVDNASIDGSLDKIKNEFEDITILKNKKNLGFTGGNNVAIQYALQKGFDYVMLLNNDTLVEKRFLEPLYQTLEKDSQLGAVQPLMYFLNEREKLWNGGGRFNSWTGASISIKQAPNYQFPYYTDWITGCCIMVRTEVIRKVGVLNDRYFAYFEDVDWSLRMRKAGFSLQVVPGSIIYHEAAGSSKTKKKGKEGFLNPKAHYLNARNQLFQIRNHLGFPHILFAWPFQLGKLFAYGAYFILRNRPKKLKAIFRGIRDGISMNCQSENQLK
ncbi:glycosyltransferase family 2 protein [Echinicola jeungdonensis]|uniref:Glycosyltransferase family 2 protein n=1 Tax=Echinicola jeungdonensis TaxID=709343 RepID=A0ABV5J8N0_9BACT|nr:glycosyltransferase family 2 protein [Echinicola jeungdonensis]MDN3669269.1 glycosyltransferase family 2 protein [Echinicola jeungdonensis]